MMNPDTQYGLEQCGKIHVVNEADLTLTNTIDLKKLMVPDVVSGEDFEKIEFEAISYWNGNLLLTDEGRAAIYQLNLENNLVREVDPGKDLSHLTGATGMEGIAVNAEKGLIYILRERTERAGGKSEIYTFSIIGESPLRLEFREKTTIIHEEGRFSDIYYDSSEKKIYAIRSVYKGVGATARYLIDALDTNSDSGLLPEGSLSTGKNTQVLDLSTEVTDRYVLQRYVANLEGIYKRGSTIFIAADNGGRGVKCDSKSGRGTMFIQITLD